MPYALELYTPKIKVIGLIPITYPFNSLYIPFLQDIYPSDRVDSISMSIILLKVILAKILWLSEFLQVLAVRACTVGYIQKGHSYSLLILINSELILKIGINKLMSSSLKVQVESDFQLINLVWKEISLMSNLQMKWFLHFYLFITSSENLRINNYI